MTKRIFLVLLTVILLMNLMGCSADVPKNFSELDWEEQRIFAKLFAEDIVKDNLKSPSTAEVEVLSINDLGNNEYEITGFVDAENSFGARLRSNYVVKIKINEDYDEEHDGYSCKILDVQIE